VPKVNAPRLPFLPKITYSRKDFILHIDRVCRDVQIEETMEDKWVERVKSEVFDAHYFEGVIFVADPSIYVILHELIHHASRTLKYWTNFGEWKFIDYFADKLDIALSRVMKKIVKTW
jgi:hypothetical protein